VAGTNQTIAEFQLFDAGIDEVQQCSLTTTHRLRQLQLQLYYVNLNSSILTLHQNAIDSGLSKSNFKDHYGDTVIKQCLGKIAEINEFSAFDKML